MSEGEQRFSGAAMGRIWLDRGQPAKAEPELRRGIAEDPEDAEVHGLLATTLAQLERYDEALEFAQQCAGLDPEWAFGHYVTAVVQLARERPKLALRSIEGALELGPENVQTHCMHARILASMRHWEDALEAVETGLDLDPEDEDCMNLRIYLLTQLGRRSGASEGLTAALRQNPDNPETHENLGWAALNEGDAHEAIDHYRTALRLDPTSDSAREGMVEAMRARNFVYRWFLYAFLRLSRMPRRTLYMVLIGSVIARGALRGLANSQPELAVVIWPVFWGIVAFILMSWIAVPLFNLMLWMDRDGRLALDEREVLRTKLLAGMLLLTGATGGAVLAGTGLTAVAPLVCGVLVIPVMGALDPRLLDRKRNLRWGLLAVLVLSGGSSVFFGQQHEGLRRELIEAAGPVGFEDPERLAVHLSKLEKPQQDRFVALVEEATEVNRRRGTSLNVFMWSFIAFTWLA